MNFDDIYKCEDHLYIKNFVLTNLQHQLEFKAHMLKCQLEDLAASLLLFAVCDDKYIVMHLGDVGVVNCLDGNEQKDASNPDNGMAANVKVFVTSDNAISDLRLMKGKIQNDISPLCTSNIQLDGVSVDSDWATL